MSGLGLLQSESAEIRIPTLTSLLLARPVALRSSSLLFTASSKSSFFIAFLSLFTSKYSKYHSVNCILFRFIVYILSLTRRDCRPFDISLCMPASPGNRPPSSSAAALIDDPNRHIITNISNSSNRITAARDFEQKSHVSDLLLPHPHHPHQQRIRRANNSTMASPPPPQPQSPSAAMTTGPTTMTTTTGGTASRARRESRPITSIATTTTTAATPSPPLNNNLRSGGSGAGGSGSNAGALVVTSPASVVPTEETTFSLPIDIIDTPDLDELCLSPVGSAPDSRSPSPLSSTPVISLSL